MTIIVIFILLTIVLSLVIGASYNSFMHLQKAIVEVEAQVSAARRAYNATVMEYNNAVQMFPTALFATLLQLQPIDPLDLAVIDLEFEQVK